MCGGARGEGMCKQYLLHTLVQVLAGMEGFNQRFIVVYSTIGDKSAQIWCYVYCRVALSPSHVLI
jgi:hypothetical protein